MQQKNLLLAFVLSALIMVGWVALSHYLWPPPPPKPQNAEVAKIDEQNKPNGEEAKKPSAKEKADDKKTAEKKADEKKGEKESKRIADADLQQQQPTPEKNIVRLGARQR